MTIDSSAFVKLGLHGGGYLDDFTASATALRAELLSFPDWKEMSTNAGVDFTRQTGITTGAIGGDENPGLHRCREFLEQLTEQAAAVHDLVGGRVGTKLRVLMNGMAYGEGGWLLEHTDAPPAGVERISWILYLTDPAEGAWQAADGGALHLRDGDGLSVAVHPRFNRFAAFHNSDQSYHEVGPVRRRTTWPTCRLALSGWMVS